MNQPSIFSIACCVAGIFSAVAFRAQAAEPSPEDVEFFEKNVRPILVQSCQKCHGEKKQEGGLRLDTRAAFLKGGDSGAAVEPGKPDESILIEAIGYAGDVKMPPKGKLADEQIAAITEWVKRGAPWPTDTAPVAGKPGEFDLAARKAKQWIFRAVNPQSPPAVKNSSWARTSIDDFILAKLEQAGLDPAEPAEKRTLLRRVTFDLIGLPPTAAEIDAFLADGSPRAFEQVVDRLLASPHYGERWGRHWLDLVRFAETHGHEFDFEMPLAFEYRDYVIRALNADVPYNQFVTEHVAGDLIAQPRRHPTDRFNESIIGTGFWHLGEATHSPVDVRADEAGRIDNQIDVFAKTFLAQTVSCARCHDHKFDAISTKDYYALSGYLQSSRYAEICVDLPDVRTELVARLDALRREESLLVRSFAVEGARTSAAAVAKYLIASLAVLHPAFDKTIEAGSAEVRIVAAAKKRGVEPPELAKWVEQFRGPALKTPADPFHLWALLAAHPGELNGDALAAFFREQIAGEQALVERADAAEKKLVVFEDFSGKDFAGWFVSGEAFGNGPVDEAILPAEATGHNRLQSPRGGPIAHSGMISNRLEGALRSPTFTIEKNHVLYHMAGKGTKVSLIIDSYQLIRDPIYGGLTIVLDSPDRMQWFVQDVSKWVGHNAYIEVIDPGDGFVAIDRVLFADGGPPDDPSNWVSRKLLEDRSVKSPEDLSQAYADLLERALVGWGDAKKQAAAEINRDGEDAIVNWLATHDLDGTLARALARSPAPVQQKLADFAQSKQRIESRIRYSRKVMAMIDGSPEDDRVHLRGSPHKFGDVVPRRFLESLAGAEQPVPAHGSGRLELARRMVDPENPVLARVMVNRVWKHHFGEGLVRTPDDVGNMGQPPTHPELLDFLAGEFVERGWSLKQLHRQLVLSSTYQMSSLAGDPRAEEVDPQNKLWHRVNLRRLEGETIRDAVLAVSGRLDPKMFGPSVMPYLTPFMVGRGRPTTSGPLDGDGRRTVYLSVRRNFLTPMLLAFDYPIPFSTIGRRSVSNVPAQALALMNNPFVLEQAEVWARRALAEHSDAADRLRSMYASAFGRPPTPDEEQSARAFVDEQSRQYPPGDTLRPWADLAHVLFNVKEFIFVD